MPQRPTVNVAHHSPTSHHAKTPPAPGRGSTSMMHDRDAMQPQMPMFAVSPASPPGTTTPANDKSAQSGTGLPGSRSGSGLGSGSSHHCKGLSINKFGLGKIFGSSSDHSNANTNGYAVSRVPSESEVIHEKLLPADPPASASSASTIGAAPAASSGTGLAILDVVPPPPPARSKTSLLSLTPSDVAKEKKDRWNTLTVMVEPFSRTIKNRKGKTPMGEMPAKASLATTPTTAVAPSPAQAHHQTAIFPRGGKDAHSSSDNPASTIKARNDMQWFRWHSGVKPDVEDMTAVGDISTATAGTGKTRNSEQPQQMQPAHGDTLFLFSRAGWRFTTSLLVASASAASAATGADSMGSAAAKDVLRIHHGTVDQTMIATRPPPKVMKWICQVLDKLRMEFKAESEYKYRCVRAKRKKAGGRWGSGLAVWWVRMGWQCLRW